LHWVIIDLRPLLESVALSQSELTKLFSLVFRERTKFSLTQLYWVAKERGINTL
jgi:hypothetical protein